MLDAFVTTHPKWGNEGDPHTINKAKMAAEAEAEGEEGRKAAAAEGRRRALEAKAEVTPVKPKHNLETAEGREAARLEEEAEDERLLTGKGMRHKQSPSNHIANSVFFSLHSDSFNRSPIKRQF